METLKYFTERIKWTIDDLKKEKAKVENEISALKKAQSFAQQKKYQEALKIVRKLWGIICYSDLKWDLITLRASAVNIKDQSKLKLVDKLIKEYKFLEELWWRYFAYVRGKGYNYKVLSFILEKRKSRINEMLKEAEKLLY